MVPGATARHHWLQVFPLVPAVRSSKKTTALDDTPQRREVQLVDVTLGEPAPFVRPESGEKVPEPLPDR